jgi:hypothetical protein
MPLEIAFAKRCEKLFFKIIGQQGGHIIRRLDFGAVILPAPPTQTNLAALNNDPRVLNATGQDARSVFALL